MYYIANARMPTEKAHGIQLAKMCEAFIENGADLTLIVPRRKTTAATIKDFYNLRMPVRVIKIPVPDFYIAGRIGFFVSSCFFAAGYFFYLLGTRLRGKRGIVYTIDIDQFSFFLVPLLGMPYFAEIHDAKKRSWPFRFLFKYAKGIITINLAIKSELTKIFGIPETRIRAWPNSVDMRMFNENLDVLSARRKLGLPLEQYVVMYVGKVYSWKGLDTLVAAADKLPDILFYLVGGTEEELQSIGAMKNHLANLVCVGQKPFAEIPYWLWAANTLLVLGTAKDEYSYYHTSPMKLFEYSASRRPVIASRTPAIEQIFSETEVLFCLPDNPDSLAEKINDMKRDSGMARRYADSAFEKIDKIFTWSERARHILNFISQSIPI